MNGGTPVELRARALFLLFSIYGLRASEVARLRLDDFDWRNETSASTGQNAVASSSSQFSTRWERPSSTISLRAPALRLPECISHAAAPLSPRRGKINVEPRWQTDEELGIDSEVAAPIRSATRATQLLKKGSSLKEIADFLGHRTIKSVAIVAKYDRRSLRKVAAFSLAGIL